MPRTRTEEESTIRAKSWTTRDSLDLYNVEGWGLGYFGINENGRLSVHPDRDPSRGLDLYDLAMDLHDQGTSLPLLLRFSDILKSRIERLAESFADAIEETGYTSDYTVVYPIKVNQQRHIVEEIVELGRDHGVGLEAGSKPELLAALALAEDSEHIIVCNGYKDEEYLRLALMGQKLGHQVFIVMEMPQEVDLLTRVAKEMGVKPNAGIRIKLASTGSGRWAASTGDGSKFGMTPAQLVRTLDRLRAGGNLDILKLVHFHLGSQIPDIRTIKEAMAEVARYYMELRSMGVDLTHVDVGGGLGVDYEGSRSLRPSSTNYSLSEYASDIVYHLYEVCTTHDLPMPHIISESGRALTAYHSMLLINVIDVENHQAARVKIDAEADHPVLVEMSESLEEISQRSLREVYHDAVFGRERARDLFTSGVLGLRDISRADNLYFKTLKAVVEIANPQAHADILTEVHRALTDKYFCNFSVFQSLPDSWAIDHLFPIMPIHRLDEEPVRRGTLQDITCDSDGKIDIFAGGVEQRKRTLDLHALKPGDPYILGVFLTGAYQEILGDMHNLFGDTNAVHIRLRNGGYEVSDLVEGDTVTKVLEYVQFHTPELIANFRRKVARAKNLSRQEANTFIADYVEGLDGYTYLESPLEHAEEAEESPTMNEEDLKRILGSPGAPTPPVSSETAD